MIIMLNKQYRGIDIFRVIACLMVIAIHTSPLSNSFLSQQPLSDFILTRIICRVAVPFFFICSGFFIITDGEIDKSKLKKSIKKITQLYILSILLYLPINIYNQYFQTITISSFLTDLLLNGTFYHLWYLPASIIGMLIVYYLYTTIKNRKIVFYIVVFLYMIGLFGHSYYYLITKIPLLKSFIDVLGNTRNGILFAPLFLYLGMLIALRKKPLSRNTALTNVLLSLILLLFEGLLLHHFKLQKSDSLYIFLLPTSYYLFHYLLSFKGNGIAFIRNSTTIIYIIHPFVLIMIRLLTKKIPILQPFVNYGILQFISVSILSFLIAYLYQYLINLHTSTFIENPTARAWKEIDVDNLKHNLQIIRGNLSKNCQIMAVVKANAYGLGAISISKALNTMGIYDFAVASLEEAIELRKNKIKGNILILGYTHPSYFKYLKKYNLTQTIFNYEYALQLKAFPKTMVHIKIDTGMNRLGISAQQIDQILKIYQMPHLIIRGTYSHLACSDSLRKEDIAFTKHQIEVFNKTLDTIRKYGFDPKNTHLQSTYGLFNYPELSYDYVRIGLGLYGVLSDTKRNTIATYSQNLKPIASLKARIALIKQVDVNQNIGYGNSTRTTKPSTIATVAIGYGDGYPRELNNQEVLIKGYTAKIIGRICMDQMLVDITDIPITINEGDIVTLFGKDGNQQINVELLAEKTNTITNEFLTGISTRVSTIYKKEN